MKKILILGMLALGVSLQASWFNDMHQDRISGLYNECNFEKDVNGNRYVMQKLELDMSRDKIAIEDFGVIVVGWERISEEEKEVYEEIMRRASWIATFIKDQKSGSLEPRHGAMFDISYLPDDVLQNLKSKRLLGDAIKFVFLAGYKF